MSAISPNDPNKGSIEQAYQAIAPVCAQTASASAATTVMFRDMMIKTYKQKGLPVPPITFLEGMKEGIKAAPIVVAIILTQMKVTEIIENTIFPDKSKRGIGSLFQSSAMVGFVSSPILAIFNGRTMPEKYGPVESLRRLRVPQALAITAQETGCVAGVYGAERAAAKAKEVLGDYEVLDYGAAAASGGAGALSGHAGNTALTRWQSGLKIETPMQLFWGAGPRARALATFCAVYLFGKKMLTPAKEKQQL